MEFGADQGLGEQAEPIHVSSRGGGEAEFDAQVASYIVTWRQQCRTSFIRRRNIWDDCWRAYRGEEDFSGKQDWQSKIVLPKAFTSVKMATNTIKRLLSAAKKPWDIESTNPDDLVMNLRAGQLTDITKHFMDKASFLKEFSEGLECAFILGLGVWKLWWGLEPRQQERVQLVPRMVPTGGQMGMGSLLGSDSWQPGQTSALGQGRLDYQSQNSGLYPNQMSGEELNPAGLDGPPSGNLPYGSPPPSYVMTQQRQIVSEEILEGRLYMRAVDPYNFWWLPGSKLNRWVGTIEDVEISRWELIRMAEQGIFPADVIRDLGTRRIDERYKMANLRFAETPQPQNGPNEDTSVCKLTEYYGPLVWNGRMVEERAHVILGNDNKVLLKQRNPLLRKRPPYVAFSPLNLPFRTEGVGLIEQVRFIDKALSQLANLSVDTLVYRLLPVFEVALETLENQEDLETGLTPGKILRKQVAYANTPAIRQVEFQDISSGTAQTWSALDRSHGEGSLISDIAEALPRFRGQQTATETTAMQNQSESFMGGMAADIEKEAIEPLVTMALDLVLQYIDTANDPRVASILGVGADYLKGMSREECVELISGDYKVKVSGITGQLMKGEMLQNLVQFMNLIGQNPQAWLPYVNEDALLRRLLECFRPHIHDIEDIISDPATAQAKRVSMLSQEHMPELLGMMQSQGQQGAPAPPQSVTPDSALDAGMRLQEMSHEREMSMQEHNQALAQMQKQADVAPPAAPPAGGGK